MRLIFLLYIASDLNICTCKKYQRCFSKSVAVTAAVGHGLSGSSVYATHAFEGGSHFSSLFKQRDVTTVTTKSTFSSSFFTNTSYTSATSALVENVRTTFIKN